MGTRPLSAVEDYLDLPYEITVVRADGDDGMSWTARVEELGCEARARGASEALQDVRTAMERRIGEVLAEGGSVPAPREAATHSGRLLVRMPRTLHADLARLADRESVSLNALIVGVLGGALAWRRPAERAAGAPAGVSAGREDAAGPAATPQQARGGLLRGALWINLVVVALVGVVAVVLLVSTLVA